MPDIIVCYKWVADDQDVRVDATGQISLSKVKYVINEYDKNALEAAVLLKEQLGGSVAALTFGAKNLKTSLKDVLSRGADSVTWIEDPVAERQDACMAAQVLAGAIAKMGKTDLIVCGDGSSDIYSQQTAQRLAVHLGLPVIDNVESLRFENGAWQADRQLRDCVETVTFAGPAVVSVLPGIAKARIPGMKQILGAGKKPQTRLTLEEIGVPAPKSGCDIISESGATQQRKNVIFKGESPEAMVAKLVEALKKESVL